MTSQTTVHDRAALSERSSPVSVTMVATPGDASCGIGTYARDLTEALDDATVAGLDDARAAGLDDATNPDPDATTSDPPVAGAADAAGAETGPAAGDDAGGGDVGATSDAIELEQDEPTAGHFLSVALRAATRDSDVVHVQHEYGLFRRPGSIYPGLLGLVFFPVLWLATRVRQKAIVVTLHSVLTPSPEEARFSKRLYLLVMHELLARTADHLIFLSEDCEERFHEDVAQAPDEYSVLPHGVNVRDASPVDRTTARERFGFDPDDEIVVIPGFVRPPKGHDVFVDVATELPDVEFLIAGGARPKGFDQGFFEEVQAEAPPNVTITGVLDDEEFPVALATADLALLPYRVVSQSGTFNWCAAQELPVLASDRAYFRRIEDRWDVLETVGLDDVGEIADRVDALLDDDSRRAELSANIRRYKDANSFETVAGEHLRIYRSILADVPLRRGPEDEPVEATGAEEESMLAACSAQREATATSD